MSHQFLLEVLCEEIPANALPGAREQLAEGFGAGARTRPASTGCAGSNALSTVRRLVAHVARLARAARPIARKRSPVHRCGPRSRRTARRLPAAVGFAKAQGVTVDAAPRGQGPQGRRDRRHAPDRGPAHARACWPRSSPRVVAALHFPKTMRWGAGRGDVRPAGPQRPRAVRRQATWTTVVPIDAVRGCRGPPPIGHRVIAPARIDLRGLDRLRRLREARSRAAGVVVDAKERRRSSRSCIAALAPEVGCTVRPDAALLAELVELVEYPGAGPRHHRRALPRAAGGGADHHAAAPPEEPGAGQGRRRGAVLPRRQRPPRRPRGARAPGQ